MDALIPLPDDFDPYAGSAPAIPEPPPVPKADYVIPKAPPLPTVATEGETEPAKPAPAKLELIPLDYDPYSTPTIAEGSFIPEAAKAVAAGTVETTGAMLKGAAGQRQQAMAERAQEAERAKWLADNGYTGTTIIDELPPDKQKELRDAMTRANAEGAKVFDLENDLFYRMGVNTTKWSEEQFRAAHDYEDSWTRLLGQGFGSTAPFIAANFIPGLGQAVSLEAGYAAAVGSQIDDAMQTKGLTKQQLLDAIRAGGPAGLTEQVPMEVLFNKIPLPAMGRVIGAMIKVAATAAAEGGQEAVQQVWQNLVAKYNYNPKQDVMEGVLQAAIVGAAVGGAIAVPGAALHKPHTAADTVAPAGETGIPDEETQPNEGVTNNDPAAAGSTAAAQPAQPVGAPAPVTREAGKPVTPAAGAAVTVVAGTDVAPDIAAARADTTVAPDAIPEPGAAPEHTPEQLARTQAWRAARNAASPVAIDETAALTTTLVTAPEPGQAANVPAPQETTPVAAATVAVPNPAAGVQEPGTPPAPAPAAAPRSEQAAAAFPKLAAAIETARQNQAMREAAAPIAQEQTQVAPPEPAAQPQQPSEISAAPPELRPLGRPSMMGTAYSALEQLGYDPETLSNDEAFRIIEAAPDFEPGTDAWELQRALRASSAQKQPLLSAPTEPDLTGMTDEEALRAALPVREAPTEAIVLEAVAVPPVAEPAPAPAPVARKPQRSAVARQLAEETRLVVEQQAADLGPDIVEHPDLNDIIDTVSDELAKGVKKGEPPAAAIRRLVASAIEGVKVGVRHRIAAAALTAHDVATVQHAEAERIAEARRLGKPIKEGEKPEPRAKERRGKVKGGVAAEVLATQSDETLERLARKQPEDTDLQAWLKAYEQRKKVKGKGSAKAIKAARSVQTEKMEEAKARYVARREAEGKTIAAEKEEARKRRERQEEEAEKHAREASQVTAQEHGERLTEQERQEEARRKATQAKAEAAAESRRNKAAPAMKAVSTDTAVPGDRIIADKMKSAAYIRTFIDKVKAALKSVGQDMSEQRHASNLTPEENLAIFGRELLHDDTKKGEKGRKHPDFDLTEWFTALALLKGGTHADISAFRNLMSEGSISEKVTAFPVEKTGQQKLTVVGEAEMEPSLLPAPEGMPSNTIVVQTTEGGRETLTPLYTTTGAKLLLQVTKQLRSSGHLRTMVGGVYNMIRRMHGRTLMRMVGDVEVMFLPDEDMNKAHEGGAAGLFANYPAARRARGAKGYILINADIWERINTLERIDLIQHEMTHAATSFALDNNIRGTNEIVNKLRLSMKTQMQNALGSIPHQFEHAFSNNREFLTAAFTKSAFQDWMMRTHVPADLRIGIEAMLHGRPQPTWWTRFAQAVGNALAMFHPATQATNYLEQILKLHPQVMQTTARQQLLAETAVEFPHADPEKSQDYIDRFGKDALRRLRSGVAQIVSDNVLDADPHLANMEASLDGVLQRAKTVTGVSRFNDMMASRALTTRMLKRLYVPELGPSFDKIIDLLTSREHARNEEGKPGIRIVTDLIKYTVAHPREALAMGELMWRSTVAGVDPTVLLIDPANAHITRAGQLDYHRRLAHGRELSIYSGMSAEQKALIGRIKTYFQNQENKRIRLVVHNVLHEANDRNPFAHNLPPGWTVDRLVDDWVMNGRIDRPLLPGNPQLPAPNQRTPEDQQIHDALKGTAESLAGTAELRGVKGFYLPLMRDGRHILSGEHEVVTPPGAFKDKSTGGPDDKYINEFVFDNPTDMNNYLRANNAKPEEQRDQIDGKVAIEHRDPATFQKVHYKDARAHKFYRVRVQNKVVEMSDHEQELYDLKRDYDAAGFKTGLVGLRDEYMNQESAINSPQINRLIRSAQQGAGSSTTSKQLLVAGINDLFVRQLAGQRASKRRLKRKTVKGFSHDLINTMLSHNRVMSGHIANLEQAIPLARAEKQLDETLTAMQKNQYGDQARFNRLQRVVKEVRSRFASSTSRDERHWSNRWANSVMAIAAIKNLASVSYHIINATGTLLAVHMAAPRFGTYRAYRAMGYTYRKLGAHRITGIGLLETAKEMWSGAKAMRGGLHGIMPRERADYEQFLVDRMAGDPLQGLFKQGIDELKRLSLWTSAGTEAPELSEIGMSKAEKLIQRASNVTRAMGEAIESVNRSHTLLMNLRLAKDAGMSDAEALVHAVDEVERSQGGYAAENQPNMMSHGLLKIPFQFKKYGGMYAQAYFNSLIRTIKPGDRKLAAKELAHMSFLTTVFAGTSGLALMEIGHALALLAQVFQLSDDDWEDWENWQQEMLELIIGRKGAEIATRGLPRLVNLDLSDRMAQNSLVLFGNPRSSDPYDLVEYLAELAMGAGGGVIFEGILKSLHDAEDWTDYASALPLPKIFSDIEKAVNRLNDVTRNKYGTVTGEQYTKTEAAMQALGFKPASRAREYEPHGVGTLKAERREQQHQRTLLMGNYYAADDKQAAWQKIRDFNATVPREFKIDRGDLMKSRRKRMQDERADERMRREAMQ